MTSRIVDPEALADGSLAVTFFCKAFRAASLEPDGRVLAHMQLLIEEQADWVQLPLPRQQRTTTASEALLAAQSCGACGSF